MCYANSNMKLVKRNQKLHNPYSPLLIGEVKESDVVKEVNEPSYTDTQTKLLIFNFIVFAISIICLEPARLCIICKLHSYYPFGSPSLDIGIFRFFFLFSDFLEIRFPQGG